ncbi:Belongs to the short-chain dehydrogenases reductases (SDR) family [Pristimantis euphronides]
MSTYIFNSLKLANAMKDFTLSLAKEVSQSYHNHVDTLAVVGVFYIVWKGFHLLMGCCGIIKHQVFPRISSTSNRMRQYGEWAVVTGASDGIGKAYAEELSSHGLNIILLGRNTEKLQNVSEFISSTYGVKTRFIVADFNKGSEVFPSIKEALRDVDVGILVNNAGVCYEYPTYLLEVPEEKSLEIINVNTAAAVMMVYVVLPGMLQRKRGAIINMASAAGCVPVPLMTAYSASKAFLDNFTRSLRYEYASKGIFIQSLTPLFVVTKMIDFAEVFQKKSLLVPIAKEYAHSAVRTIGISLRTAGHWSHCIQLSIGRWMPEWLWLPFITHVNKAVRAEYLSRKKHR